MISFEVRREHGFYILRDDLIAGGTKRRALTILLGDFKNDRFVYAGTKMGHGAIALAKACKDLGKQAEIYISATEDDGIVKTLRDTNTILHLCPPMPIASLHAIAMEKAKGATVLPPGFDMPEFEEAMVHSLAGLDPSGYDEIWTAAVTGTLTRSLHRVFPGATLRTVKTVKSSGPLPSETIYEAPEKYHQPAKSPPPYPACPYTDAKVWQFVQTHAAPGALIWNTAG